MDSGLPGDLKVFLSCVAYQFLMPPFSLQLAMDKCSPTKEQQQNWYEFTPLAEKLCSQAQQAFSLTHARGIKLGLMALLRQCGGGSRCCPFSFARAVKLRLCSSARICHVTFQMVSKEQLANRHSQVLN